MHRFGAAGRLAAAAACCMHPRHIIIYPYDPPHAWACMYHHAVHLLGQLAHTCQAMQCNNKPLTETKAPRHALAVGSGTKTFISPKPNSS